QIKMYVDAKLDEWCLDGDDLDSEDERTVSKVLANSDTNVEKLSKLSLVDTPEVDRVDQVVKDDQVDQVEPNDITPDLGDSEGKEKVDQVEKPEQADQVEKPEQVDQVEKPEQVDQVEKMEKV